MRRPSIRRESLSDGARRTIVWYSAIAREVDPSRSSPLVGGGEIGFRERAARIHIVRLHLGGRAGVLDRLREIAHAHVGLRELHADDARIAGAGRLLEMLGRIAELAVETAHLAEQELVVGLAVLVRALRDVSEEQGRRSRARRRRPARREARARSRVMQTRSSKPPFLAEPDFPEPRGAPREGRAPRRSRWP